MDKEQCGKLIHFLRKEKGLSQKEFAEAMHVTPSCVCKWEQGTSLPDTCMIETLANFFAISCDDFYHPEDTLYKLCHPQITNAQQPKILFPLAFVSVIILTIVLVFCIKRTPFTELSSQYAEYANLGYIYQVEFTVSWEQDEHIIAEHAKDIITSLEDDSSINNGINAIVVLYYFTYDDKASDFPDSFYCQMINEKGADQ